MNKPEIGMYVKFKTLSNQIKIGQIKEIDGSIYDLDNDVTADKYVIGKPSFDIIDLVEAGDILLLFDKEYGKKYKVEVMGDRDYSKTVVNYEQNDLLNLEYELITNEHIELLKILTKEQFESMSYRIGE